VTRLTSDTLNTEEELTNAALDDYLLSGNDRPVPMANGLMEKKASLGALVSEEEDLPATYSKIKSDLMANGTSPILELIDEEEKAEQEEIDIQVAKNLALSSSTGLPKTDEEIRQEFKELEDQKKKRPKATLEEILVYKDLANMKVGKKKFLLMKDAGEVVEQQKLINRMVDLQRVKLGHVSDKPIENSARFLVSSMAPGWGVLLSNLVEDMNPGSTSLWDKALPGEVVKQFRSNYDNATVEEKLEIVQRLGSLVEENSGFLVEDNMVAKEFLEILVRNADPTTDELENDKILSNLIAAVDIVPLLGSAVSSGVRAIKSLRLASGGIKPDTAIALMDKVDPEATKEVLVATVKTKDEELLASLGVTKEDIVLDKMLPMPDGSEIRLGTDIDADAIGNRVKQELGENTHGINYTESEKTSAQLDYKDRVSYLEEFTGTTLISKTKIRPITGGFEAQVAIGRTSDEGFDTVDEAMHVAEQYLENLAGAETTIYRADRVKGEYTALNKDTLKILSDNNIADDYIFTLGVEHHYNKFDTLKFVEGDTVGTSGEGAKYLDISTVFNGWVVKAINRAGDTSDKIKSDLHAMMRPLTKMYSWNQRPVLSVIDEGSLYRNEDGSIGKWFSTKELEDRFHEKGIDRDSKRSKKLVAAYHSYREFQREMFNLNNNRIRTSLENEGYKNVTISTRPRKSKEGTETEPAIPEQLIGKTILKPHIQRAVRNAYDPDTGAIVDLTPGLVDSLYADGSQIVKLKFPRGTDSGRTSTHAIIKKSSGDSISNLPEVVLKTVEGYGTRIHEATHLVREYYQVIEDGVRTVKSRVVTLENNPRSASAAARILNERASINAGLNEVFESDLSAKSIFKSERSSEIQNVDYARGVSAEYYHDRGQIFTSSRRPEELRNFAGKRVVKDLGESISLAIDNVSKHVSMDDLIESLIQRWENTYAKDFGVIQVENGPRVFPGTGKIPEPAELSLRRAKNDAVALQDRINFLMGTDNTKVEKLNELLFVRGSEWLADKTVDGGEYWNSVAAKIIGLKDSPIAHPIRVAKNIAFLRYIVAMPVKQAWMQSNTASMALGMEHGASYFANQGLKDAMGLFTGLSMKRGSGTWNVMAPKLAKAMDMDVKEYEAFLDAYNRTGLHQSVESHVYTANMALTPSIGGGNMLTGVLRDTAEMLKSTARVSRDIGFGTGERVNIGAGGFLLARERWIRNYTGKGDPKKLWMKKDNLDFIAGEARELTLNMSQAGATALQKGGLGFFFQFLSHSHKAMQAVIPDKWFLSGVANKAFTNREKRRLAATQVLLYGTVGIPFVKETVDYIINNAGIELGTESVELRENIEEGLVSTALVYAMDLATSEEDESHSMVSKGIAPLSAVATGGNSPLHKTLTAFYDLTQGNYLKISQDLMPPGINATSDLGKSLLTMAWLAGGVDLDKTDPSKMRLILEEALSLAPQLDKYFTARLSLEAGVLANSYGDPQIVLTWNEMLLNAGLGAPPRELEEVKVLSRKIKGTGFGRITSPVGDDLRSVARTVYKLDKALIAKVKANPTGSLDEFSSKIKSTREILKWLYTDKEFTIINKHMMKLRKGDSNELATDKFGKDLVSALSSGDLDYSSPLVTEALNTFFLQDKKATRLRIEQGKALESANTERVEQENL